MEPTPPLSTWPKAAGRWSIGSLGIEAGMTDEGAVQVGKGLGIKSAIRIPYGLGIIGTHESRGLRGYRCGSARAGIPMSTREYP